VTRPGCLVARVFKRAAAPACLAALTTTACSHSPRETTAQSSESIWQGEPSGPADDGVVFLIAKGSKTSRCTATLVAPNLVITAKHCIVEFSSEPFSCTSEGELTAGSRGGAMGAMLAPENISFAVGRDPGLNPVPSALALQIFSVATPSICRNDIAMVLLDRDIPDLPLVPMRLGKGNSRGETLRLVGYGADHDGTFGKRNTLSGQRISQVGVSVFLGEENADPVPPRTFMTLGPSLCIGDSGGPALTENEAITAVWSQLVGECGDEDARNFFTQIAPFEDTIVRPAFEAAGHEPLLEVEMGSGGAPTADAGAGGEPAGSGASGGSETGAAGSETSAGGAPAQAGAGSAEGGTPSTPGGDAGVGGEPDIEPPTYRKPRKSGGLKCELAPGVRQTWHASGAALLLGLAWAMRRARSNRRGY
jgi:hypothetical protein